MHGNAHITGAGAGELRRVCSRQPSIRTLFLDKR